MYKNQRERKLDGFSLKYVWISDRIMSINSKHHMLECTDNANGFLHGAGRLSQQQTRK